MYFSLLKAQLQGMNTIKAGHKTLKKIPPIGVILLLMHSLNRQHIKQIITIALLSYVLISCKSRQFCDDLEDVLSTKKFYNFKLYTDSLSKKDRQIKSYCDYSRELTYKSKEGVYYFERSVPHKDNIYISSVYKYRVSLITTGNKIIKYDLCEKKLKKTNDKFESYYETICKYKNDDEFFKLRIEFKNIFRSELIDSELFNDNIVYGHSCGFLSADPKEKVKIDEFVRNRDKDSLIKWLQSTITEKQIYAIDGLFQLKSIGIHFNDYELKMMKFVAGKKGTIHVCSGCEYYTDSINNVITKFKI